MKITQIKVSRFTVPLKTPFKTALRTVLAVEDVLVEINTDTGCTGFGEAPPTAAITGETIQSIEAAVLQHIAPSIIGMDICQLDCIMQKMHACILNNTSAKAAIDMALYDLLAQHCKLPLYQLLGGAKTHMETDITISLNNTAQMVSDSITAVQAGFSILKIKVGLHGMADVQRIAEIRKAVGQQVQLRIDANQGWGAKQSVQIITAMEDAGLAIALVEQPVKAHDISGMAFVTQQVHTPILADESVFTAENAIALIQRRAADYINIKLMKTGGIYKALQICAVAETYGVSCMMGCMLESKLATSAAAHLAAAKNVITMVDLDTPSLCAQDPFFGGPVYSAASILMPDSYGIGIASINPACKNIEIGQVTL